jgi:hypothetical protein
MPAAIRALWGRYWTVKGILMLPLRRGVTADYVCGLLCLGGSSEREGRWNLPIQGGIGRLMLGMDSESVPNNSLVGCW